MSYDPRNINQMYEQYGRTHGGSSNKGSTYDETPQTITRGLGTPLGRSFSTRDDDDDKKDDVGGVKSFFSNVFSLFTSSGAEPKEPPSFEGSSVYDRKEFNPIATARYDPSESRITVGYDPRKPIRSSDEIMGDIDAMFDRSDDAGYTPDPALGSTYDEVKEQDRPPTTIEDAINTAIENTIPTAGYKVKKGDTLSEIAQATGRTVKELQQLNDITDPRKMQAGSTLKIPVQTAQDKEVVEGARSMSELRPLRTANQSMMTGSQREYEPEIGEDSQSVLGYDDVPQTVRGLMSKTDIVDQDFDTSDVVSSTISYKSVENVQKRLNDLGYTTLVGDLTVDGKLGKGTARQLRKFQATAGLPPTATAGQPVDEATMKALKNNKFNNKEGKDPAATVTPLQDGLFEIIKAPIAYLESRGYANPYAISGGAGNAYDGKYQLGKDAKDTIKFMRDENGERIFTAEEREKLNHPSNRADFRGDSELQEKAFRALTDFNHSELTKNSAKYRAMDQANQLAVLGYAHNQGAEAALEWLTTSVVGTDAFGTGGDEYSKAITEVFTKDDMLG